VCGGEVVGVELRAGRNGVSHLAPPGLVPSPVEMGRESEEMEVLRTLDHSARATIFMEIGMPCSSVG